MTLPDTTGIEAKKSGFAPLPDGEYIGMIAKIDEGLSFEKQTPFVNFEIDIKLGDYAGRKVWKRCYLKGDTEEKTKTMLGMYAGILESLGMTREQRHAITTVEQLRAFALRLEVKIYVTQREYNGKISNDVSSIDLNDSLPF